MLYKPLEMSKIYVRYVALNNVYNAPFDSVEVMEAYNSYKLIIAVQYMWKLSNEYTRTFAVL